MTRTGKLVYDETSEDWSASFASAWAANGGHSQSLAFAIGAIRRLATLPEFAPFMDLHYAAPDRVAFEHFTIHDYGCACGDGTAALAAAFAGASVTGFDTSEVAVETARERWPGIAFESGDARWPTRDATIIFTSHTLEHTRDAAECVTNLLRRCAVLVVVVPWITKTRHAGHEGAEPTATWLARCPPFAHRAAFNIMRRNPSADAWLAEGSLMFVWQGALR